MYEQIANYSFNSLVHKLIISSAKGHVVLDAACKQEQEQLPAQFNLHNNEEAP